MKGHVTTCRRSTGEGIDMSLHAGGPLMKGHVTTCRRSTAECNVRKPIKFKSDP